MRNQLGACGDVDGHRTKASRRFVTLIWMILGRSTRWSIGVGLISVGAGVISVKFFLGPPAVDVRVVGVVAGAAWWE